MKLPLAALGLALAACADPPLPPSAAATIVGYRAAEEACIPDADVDASRLEVAGCICQVRANYGRSCEGGVP